jgi:hypothetical protein
MIELIVEDNCHPTKQKQVLNGTIVKKLSQQLEEHGLILRIAIESIQELRWNPKKKKIDSRKTPSALYEVYDSNSKLVLKSSIDDILDIQKWYIKHYGTLFEKRESLVKH